MSTRMGNLLSLTRRSLRTKLPLWFFVPTALILLAVALVNFYAYQDVTEDLVIERDQDLTRLSAGQLGAELTEYIELLESISRIASVTTDETTYSNLLQESSVQQAVFDGGLVIVNTIGEVVAAEPDLAPIVGQDWSNRAYFRQLVRSQNPAFSNVSTIDPLGMEVVTVSVPITGNQGELLGAVIGLFRVSDSTVSAFYGGIVKLRIAESGTTYLVDGDGRVIYHTDPSRIAADFSNQPVVQRVLNGEASAIRTEDFDGRDIVAGFAQVPGTPWGLITEETWASLISGSRGYQQFLLLLLALGIAVPVLFVAIGLRQIMRPIKSLTREALRIASGDFDHNISVKTGDEIQVLAEQLNTMAGALKDSYADLEQKVETRTKALRESETMLRQSEKMAALGTLTAGVAHELNNPAAAARSGAGQLETAIAQFEQAQSQLRLLELTSAQQSTLQRLTHEVLDRATRPPELNALARSDREGKLEIWMEELGIPEAWKLAPSLVNLDYDTDRLTALAKSFAPDQLSAMISSLDATYSVYNLLTEIGQSTERISEIVKALKSYSYLDQAPVQDVDVHEGLDNTLLVLGHKLKYGISVRREYATGLPNIQANGSELNQVWTNIIDSLVKTRFEEVPAL